MYNLAIALYWCKLAALLSGLMAAVGVIPTSPFVGIILFLLFQELSELAMTLFMKQEAENESDS